MNSTDGLKGKRILIAEDEALVAMDLFDLIEHVGGTVIGPCSTVNACGRVLEATDSGAKDDPDAAILDVRLGKEEVFGVAEELEKRGVAIVFHSGHADAAAILTRFPNARFCAKPASEDQLVGALLDVTRKDCAEIAAE